MLHSADFPHGLASFADWRAFSEASDKRAGAAITVPLCFALEPVGFVVALLPKSCPLGARGHLGEIARTDELAALARSLSASVALSRLNDFYASSLSALRIGTHLCPNPRDAYPERVARKLEARQQFGSGSLRCPIPVKSELESELDWASARLSAAPSAPASAGLSGSSGESADIISDYWPCVTVVFADVTNFTEMTSGQNPVETMELLSNLFHLLDSLTLSHGVYKMETVGDTVRGGAEEGARGSCSMLPPFCDARAMCGNPLLTHNSIDPAAAADASPSLPHPRSTWRRRVFPRSAPTTPRRR